MRQGLTNGEVRLVVVPLDPPFAMDVDPPVPPGLRESLPDLGYDFVMGLNRFGRLGAAPAAEKRPSSRRTPIPVVTAKLSVARLRWGRGFLSSARALALPFEALIRGNVCHLAVDLEPEHSQADHRRRDADVPGGAVGQPDGDSTASSA